MYKIYLIDRQYNENLAFEKLEEIKISDEGRESLKAFGKNLMERKF